MCQVQESSFWVVTDPTDGVLVCRYSQVWVWVGVIKLLGRMVYDQFHIGLEATPPPLPHPHHSTSALVHLVTFTYYNHYLPISVASLLGETVEENANLVVRLLIRHPECLGPALRGEGKGLLTAMEEAIILAEELDGFIPGTPAMVIEEVGGTSNQG